MFRKPEDLATGTRVFPVLARPAIRLCGYLAVLVLLVGCASYGKVVNNPIDPSDTQLKYSLRDYQKLIQASERPNEISLILTFSGGGTRAAAMAFGVLEELRDTQVQMGTKPVRLLDEVDYISSVSGGSFTAAFYGLHGEAFFDTFEDEFLLLNMNKALTRKLLNPVLWFSKKGRTESAVEYYEKALFHGATFADMIKPDSPMIIINASDLSHGVRFSFIQDYFKLLCSDLSSYPLSRAVAASSAVPMVFNPIVVKNHGGCGTDYVHWPDNVDEKRQNDAEFNDLYNGAESFRDKENRKFVHLVDGGITDNMGLRAVYDMIQVAGGIKAYLEKAGGKVNRRVVYISVNASTNPVTDMDKSNKQPSMLQAMNAMSGVQLHRYNSSTLEVMSSSLQTWVAEISTPELPVSAYFIPVSFEDVEKPQLKYFLNKIPTSFSLTKEQVDAIIESGRNVLRNNPEFQKLLSDMAAQDQ